MQINMDARVLLLQHCMSNLRIVVILLIYYYDSVCIQCVLDGIKFSFTEFSFTEDVYSIPSIYVEI